MIWLPALALLVLQFGSAASGQDAALPGPDPLELVMEKHLGEGACEDPGSDHMKQYDGISADLGPTSVLYAIPCSAGGANVSYRLYSHETGEIGGVETLYFASYSATNGWTGTDLLHNVEVDGPKLKARFKPGASGACGTLAEWTWVDYAYRLDRFAVQEPCRGDPPSWKTVYPAS